LTNSAVGFIRARSSAPTMPRVSGAEPHADRQHVGALEQIGLLFAAS
jgi:hypothetical protein